MASDDDSSSDGSGGRRNQRSGKYRKKVFPIRNEALVQILKAWSNVGMSVITALNIFAASIPYSWVKDVKPGTKSVLMFLPFIFLPLGMLTVCTAHGAEHQRNLLGAAAAMMLVELLYSFGLLSVVSTVVGLLSEQVAGSIFAFAAGTLLGAWSFVFKYPKRLKKLQQLSPYQVCP